MPDNDYVLGHSITEIARLKRQAKILRPTTERLLAEAGVGQGMRVLDIGCGPGDVSMLIADLVGPTGSVVGIDPSGEAVDAARQRFRELGRTNVDFVQHSVETYDGRAGFDAAVCRYVLIHQTDPSEFLRATRRLVRNGGIIALHETDLTRGIQSNPRIPLLHEIYDAASNAVMRSGAAVDVGGRLVQVFSDADLPAPMLFSQTLVECGATAMLLPWLADVARVTLQHMVAAGAVTEDQIQIATLSDRLRRAAIESKSQLEFIPQMCAWTRV